MAIKTTLDAVSAVALRWLLRLPLRKVILGSLIATMFGYSHYIVIDMAQRKNHLMISDAFAPYAFYLDIVGGEYPVSGWSIAPVTNIFPSAFFTISILSIVGDFGNALVLYFGLNFLFFSTGLFALCRLLGASIGRGLTFVACALFILTIDSRFIGIAEWLDPIRHGGNLLMVLISLIALLGGIQNGFTKTRYIALATLTGMGLLGDLLYAPIFLLPMLLVTAFLVIRAHVSRKTGSLIFLSAMIGVLGYWISIKAIHLVGIQIPSNDFDSFSLERFLLTLRTFGRVLWDEFRYSPVIVSCSLFSIGVLGHIASKFVMARRSSQLPFKQPICVLALMVLLGFGGNFLTALMGPQGFHWDSGIFRFRYVHGGMIFLPVFALCALASTGISRISKTAGFMVALGAIATVLGVWVFEKDRNIVGFASDVPRSFDLPYPPLAKCVDEFAMSINRKFGLSAFEDAKRLTYYSRVGIRVNSMERSIPVANKYWHVVKQEDGQFRLPEYGFIVADQNFTHRIRETFGNPSKEKRCLRRNGSRILVFAYDRESDYKLRELRLPAAMAIGPNLPPAGYNQDTIF